MDASVRIASVVSVALLCAGTRGEQHSPDLRRVGVERAALNALPQSEGSPVLAELLAGTAVRVVERRDGFARVAVDGWIDEAALAELEESPPESPTPEAKPPKREPPAPVHDLALAHHVGVRAEVRTRGAVRELALSLELLTLQGAPVIVDGARHAGRIRVFEQRRIAGGRARGAELVARAVTFEAGRASIEVALGDLGEVPPRMVLVSATAELAPQRAVHGAATDVEIPAR